LEFLFETAIFLVHLNANLFLLHSKPISKTCVYTETYNQIFLSHSKLPIIVVEKTRKVKKI